MQVDDGHGNVAQAATTLQVNDALPVLSLPANQTFEATSASGAVVNFTGATASDYDDSPVTITYSPAEATQFPFGTTTVTATAENADGTTATGTFTVTVRDTTPPTTSASLSGTAGSNGWYTSPVTVSLSASDTGSGVATTFYRIGSTYYS